ncbi:DNA polymerase III subunit chi [Sphingomonas sp. ASV193]|uniref:DNA polymerase III subunit chi n=1 Tax=Sphingomonas sp. ASV193 TaxID=3144405 RepID=UPI0032E90F09
MRVDFYQFGGAASADAVIASIAGRLLGEGQRLVVVHADEGERARLDRQLWDQGAASFVPHGVAGGADDSRQPVLITGGSDAPNGARNLLIADGEWRESALSYDRAFFLFDADGVAEARLAWKLLSGRDAERHYWAHEDGRWVEKG